MTNAKLDSIDEIWLPVVGYEGLYEVSNHGRVKSVRRLTKSRYGLKTSPGQVLKPKPSNVKYLRVDLCKDGVARYFLIHRLVAIAHLPNPDKKPCVNHIDADKNNNSSSNLEWCTYKENTNHALENGIFQSTPQGFVSTQRAEQRLRAKEAGIEL